MSSNKLCIESNENYLDDISYSICIDTKKTENKNAQQLKYTLPRKTYAWIDNNNASSCYNCEIGFNWIMRRHHCRLCGKVFCGECSKYKDIIPEDLLSDDSKKVSWNDYFSSYIISIDFTKYRTCISCHNIIDQVNSVKKLTEVFKILNLDVRDLKKIACVCKIWLNASNYYLSKFREIQYKLPTDQHYDWEKKMLWLNAKYFSGHSKFLLHLLKICETDKDFINIRKLLKSKKSIKCRSLMCNRNCQEKLSSFDAINLLAHYFKNSDSRIELKKIAIDHLVCSDKEFKCYIPFLVNNIINDSDDLISDFLINRCYKNFSLLTSLYWELQLYTKIDGIGKSYNKIYNKLKQEISDDNNQQDKFVSLLQGNHFMRAIEDISKAIYEDNKKYNETKDSFILQSDMILPLNTNVTIKKLCIDKIMIKNSATKPMIIPCETSDGSICQIMHKNESVRKDQIILAIITLMQILVKKDEGIDVEAVLYNVLPISKNSGLVEIVDNCDTIYFIQEKLQTTILNYILENNGSLKIQDLRKKFIKTTAFYSVFTYLLGIGDRHLDNIMVTKDGRLFHVDFDYILGNDPVFTNPGIRITHEIVEAIGGFNSKYYSEFKEMCTKIYNCIRRNIDIFIHMVNLIPKISDLKLTEQEIREQIIRRFIPGENTKIAKIHFMNQLEKQNYTNRIKDWCHYHSKEKTISKLSGAISSLWSPTKL